jgi:hypothetical protein
MTDPFDAEHPDNLPAYLEHQQALAEAELWNPAHSRSEWREIRAATAEYPAEVGFDARPGRVRLPIGYEEWNAARTHPCWPEYREQMDTLPAGEAIGFYAWLGGGQVGRGDAATRARPTRPFLCGPYTELPAGWVRGDRDSTDRLRPYLQIAHHPTRHCVVRCIDLPAEPIQRRLTEAGFRALTTADGDGPQVTYFVRDAVTGRQPGRRPPAQTGRSL